MKRTIIILLFLSLIPKAHAEDWSLWDHVRLSGFFKNQTFVTHFPLEDSEFNISQVDVKNIGRINLYWEIVENLTFDAAYGASVVYTYKKTLPLLVFTGAAASSYRITDLNETFFRHNVRPLETGYQWVGYQNLDRLYLTYSAPQFDIKVGRQPISFGSARVVNPTDVLVPFSFTTIDTENRFGLDAARLKIALGETAELDGGWVFGDDFELDQSAAFSRLTIPIKSWEVAPIWIKFRRHHLVGLDVQGNIGGTGVWTETAYSFMSDDDTPLIARNFFRITSGAQHFFTDDFSGYFEYHYNGAGTGTKTNYMLKAFELAYSEGGVFLLGQHYLIPGFTYQLTPLTMVAANAIVNLRDGSFLLSLMLEWNILQDVYLDLGGFIGVGERPTTALPFGFSRSEFGLYSTTLYAFLRAYF